MEQDAFTEEQWAFYGDSFTDMTMIVSLTMQRNAPEPLQLSCSCPVQSSGGVVPFQKYAQINFLEYVFVTIRGVMVCKKKLLSEYPASNRCDEHDGQINVIRVNCTVAGCHVSVAEDNRGI
jgi:hypothetical protein